MLINIYLSVIVMLYLNALFEEQKPAFGTRDKTVEDKLCVKTIIDFFYSNLFDKLATAIKLHWMSVKGTGNSSLLFGETYNFYSIMTFCSIS